MFSVRFTKSFFRIDLQRKPKYLWPQENFDIMPLGPLRAYAFSETALEKSGPCGAAMTQFIGFKYQRTR
jgi:hypothetical protein